MSDKEVVSWIREKYISLVSELDERGRRRWAAIEARSLGYGGIAAVAEATGISDRTIRTGLIEIESGSPLPASRQRRIGGGRKSLEESQPGITEALNELVSPTTRGAPNNPLRWTCKSTRTLGKELRQQNYQVSASSIGTMLKELGFSLQSNRKTREGKQHPDRDAQFEFINRRTLAFLVPSQKEDGRRRRRSLWNGPEAIYLYAIERSFVLATQGLFCESFSVLGDCETKIDPF